MKITCPHCHQSMEAAAKLAGNVAACPTCKGYFEIPVPPPTLPRCSFGAPLSRLPQCDPSFQAARQFLCGTLRVQFVLGCLGLLGVMALLTVNPPIGIFLLLFIAVMLALIQTAIQCLVKACGVTAWSLVFALFGIIAFFGHVTMLTNASDLPSGAVFGAMLGLILDLCLMTGSFATAITWHNAAHASSKKLSLPADPTSYGLA